MSGVTLDFSLSMKKDKRLSTSLPAKPVENSNPHRYYPVLIVWNDCLKERGHVCYRCGVHDLAIAVWEI